VDIDEDAVRDIDAMEEWAMACGVQKAEGFKTKSDMNPNDLDSYLDILDYEDVSVWTIQDIPAGSPVLYVPKEMIFSSHQAAQEIGRLEHAEKLYGNMKASDQIPYFYLGVRILVEYEKGEASAWFPWLNSLPRYFSNGASMTPFCYECLPPLVASLTWKEQSNCLSFDAAIKLVPIEILSDSTKENKDLVKWAFQMAYTRSSEANDGSGDLRIVPMADLFNHGTFPNVAIGYDDQGNCYAQTTDNVSAGNALTVSYADPTNPSYLFARYGFIDKTSPATFCKIVIDDPSPQLVDMGYDQSRMLFYKDTGEVSQEVWDVLLYQVLASSDENQAHAFYQAHMNGDYDTKQAFHQQHYPETLAALQNHLDSFLEELENLSQKAKGKNLFVHPRLPLILQHNEFVKKTFLAVRENYFR